MTKSMGSASSNLHKGIKSTLASGLKGIWKGMEYLNGKLATFMKANFCKTFDKVMEFTLGKTDVRLKETLFKISSMDLAFTLFQKMKKTSLKQSLDYGRMEKESSGFQTVKLKQLRREL